MELVTGYGGKAHITPENWADLNRGFSGADSYVMGTGRKFEAELISNNLLKIHDGCGIMQGRQVVIPKGRSNVRLAICAYSLSPEALASWAKAIVANV